VMNTDNMSISGETIDYGPCAFMDAYDPATVFSSIDEGGRYAYGRQPGIARWNLSRLAECLLPLLADDEEAALAEANAAIDRFADLFTTAYHDGLRRKLGLFTTQEGDVALAQDLLARMAANQADFTLTFRRLCDAAENAAADADMRRLFADPASYDEWAISWRQRLAQEPEPAQGRRAAMQRANPAFIPRNHRIEEALEQAVTGGDFTAFETLLTVLSAPYEDQPGYAAYAEPPAPGQGVYRTFCGT
jgi:serine/tyrosine/threonine adenylyltransferase